MMQVGPGCFSALGRRESRSFDSMTVLRGRYLHKRQRSFAGEGGISVKLDERLRSFPLGHSFETQIKRLADLLGLSRLR